MTVRVSFECSGCFLKAEGTRWLQRTWEEMGKYVGGSIGRYIVDTPQDVAPKGWIACDPYTGCCYCPACWASIIEPKTTDMKERIVTP